MPSTTTIVVKERNNNHRPSKLRKKQNKDDHDNNNSNNNNNNTLVIPICCSTPTLFGLVGILSGISLVLTFQLLCMHDAGSRDNFIVPNGFVVGKKEEKWSVLPSSPAANLSNNHHNNQKNYTQFSTQPQRPILQDLPKVSQAQLFLLRNTNHLTVDQNNAATLTTQVMSSQKQDTKQHWAERYHEAWYIDDQPDWESFHRIYEDERITKLVQQQEQGNYQPYQAIMIMNQTTTLGGGGGDSIFFSPRARQTALDSLNHTNNSTNNNSSSSDGRFVYSPSANHTILTTLRTLESTVANFNPVCHRYRFPNITLFPTVSIIIPMQHERAGLLSLTVHSFLGRTPPELLKEIIIVDDNGSQEEREGYVDDEEEIQHLMQLHPTKIKYFRNERRLGCAGSRMAAIRQATGEVMVVMDSHVEILSSTWLQHLLLPIMENPKTYAMQTLDALDDRSPGYHRRPSSGQQHWGFVADNFVFKYLHERFGSGPSTTNGRETPPLREPFETPFAPGSLFAIRIDEFWRLGGYDQGLEVWGGENTELTMKVWRCGFNDPDQPPGRVVVVPCSRAGHVYRQHIKETGRWPPKIPDYVAKQYGLLHTGKWKFRGQRAVMFNRLLARNNLRIIRVWMGKDAPTTRNYYYRAFGVKSTDPNDLPPEWRRVVLDIDQDPEIARQESIRDQNQCKSYDWFERHVVYRLVGQHTPLYAGHPGKFGSNETSVSAVSCGAHFARDCVSCPRGNGESWCNGECQWCPNAAKEHTRALWTTVTITTTIKSENSSNTTGNAITTTQWELSEKSRCVPLSMTCRSKMPKPPQEPISTELGN
ncbi:hypothetical protein ACA910_001820 [Epithemia clementina (nom. ined.)]